MPAKKNETIEQTNESELTPYITNVKVAYANPSISINIKPYSNITYSFDDTDQIDRAKVLKDIEFWLGILTEIEQTMPASKPTVPDNVEVLVKCPKCGGSNLMYATGISKSTGKPWHAFDCQSCKTKRGNEEYPTRNFVNLKRTITEDADSVMGTTSDEDCPF